MLSNSTTSPTSASRKPTLTGYMTPKSTPTANPTDATCEGGAAITKSLSSAGLVVLVAGCMMLL
jgi:hypothetical protein